MKREKKEEEVLCETTRASEKKERAGSLGRVDGYQIPITGWRNSTKRRSLVHGLATDL